MGKNLFTRTGLGILVLILFAAFLSSCKQNSAMEEGLLTTDSENGKSISQTETVATAAVYVPAPVIEYPGEPEDVRCTLTPTFLWFQVPGATKYQFSIYWVTTASGKRIRIYTSALLNPQIPGGPDGLQSYTIPAGVLDYDTQFGYQWCVRAKIGASTSEYNCASFQVLRY